MDRRSQLDMSSGGMDRRTGSALQQSNHKLVVLALLLVFSLSFGLVGSLPQDGGPFRQVAVSFQTWQVTQGTKVQTRGALYLTPQALLVVVDVPYPMAFLLSAQQSFGYDRRRQKRYPLNHKVRDWIWAGYLYALLRQELIDLGLQKQGYQLVRTEQVGDYRVRYWRSVRPDNFPEAVTAHRQLLPAYLEFRGHAQRPFIKVYFQRWERVYIGRFPQRIVELWYMYEKEGKTVVLKDSVLRVTDFLHWRVNEMIGDSLRFIALRDSILH